MKKKELNEFRNKEKTQINDALTKMRSELTKAEMNIKAGKEKNLKKVKNLRHNISQIMTVIREKEYVNQDKNKGESKE